MVKINTRGRRAKVIRWNDRLNPLLDEVVLEYSEGHRDAVPLMSLTQNQQRRIKLWPAWVTISY